MKTLIRNPLVTVITPVFNNVSDIGNCIRSVANQSFENKEHLIIDGGSTDGTLEEIVSLAKTYKHLKYVSESDDGIYEAMNKGIAQSNGSWLYFLGSDDELYDDNILTDILLNPKLISYDILYGKIKLKEYDIILGEESDINSLKVTCTHHQATFFKKAVFEKLGYYNTEYSVCADWAFTIKCFQSPEIKLKYIDKIVAIYSTLGFSDISSGSNTRLNDKTFNDDFFSLFNDFSFSEKISQYMYDYLPKFLNPIVYLRYIRRNLLKISVRQIS